MNAARLVPMARVSVLPRALRTATPSAAHIVPQRRYASGDYGSGKGDPVGENPQQQGKNSSENLEHPGPPPPKVGQTQSSSSNQGSKEQTQQKTSSSQESSSSTSGYSDSKDAHETHGAQPKILSDNPPAEDASEDVKRHNEELARRPDHPRMGVDNADAENDKVPPGFWSGQGGADREP